MGEQNGKQLGRADWVVGLSIYGAALAGTGALLLAVITFFAARLEAAATALVAAAVAFGALANAVFRN